MFISNVYLQYCIIRRATDTFEKLAFFGVSQTAEKAHNLKLENIRQKLELAALLRTVFISHAYLQACATGKDESEI